jgi:GAF domain-containing protein/anti-sigma regulatory factor (Ser/Thr protein kinase)
MASEASTVSGDQSVEALRRELAEAREQQAATAEILAVISSSPMDLQRVFADMAASAARLCDAYDAVILQIDSAMLRQVGHFGPIPTPQPASGPLPLARGTVSGRAILEGRTFQVADLQAETNEYPEGSDFALRFGFRTQLAVPLIRAGGAIGVIVIRRREARTFTDRQIDLLKTFADQAVIAIENARLFEEVRARTRELSEALEQQTATSEVLQVISSSPGELEPVFRAVLANATRISGAKFGFMHLYDGGTFRTVAMHNAPPAFAEMRRSNPVFRPGPRTGLDRAVRSKQVVQIPDLKTEQPYRGGDPSSIMIVELAGARTLLVVPMLKGDELIGTFAIYRQEVRPFTDKQVDLVRNFARQAVIAIENVRLLNELRESLRQQTATADVLKAISRSTFDLQPVLEALIKNATKLCAAEQGFIFRSDGEVYHLAADYNAPAGFGEWAHRRGIPPGDGSVVGRVALEDRTIQILDAQADAAWRTTNAEAPGTVGVRTLLGVPMRRKGVLIGVIAMWRTEIRAFTDKQLALVETFADQAVIAIENTRLLNELRESLQQQTATADVLKVISRSAFDLQAVLDALVESAAKLCGGDDVSMFRLDGETLSSVAHCGPMRATAGNAIPAVRGTVSGRSVIERRPIHVADLQTETEDYPEGSAIAREFGHHTILVVPLMREGTPLGVITLRRNKVEPFSDKQIELVTTFADQAVIAIENTRLFEEVQTRTRELTESLEYQTATSDVLGVISCSPTNVQPVFDTIAQAAAQLCKAQFSHVFRFDGHLIHFAASHGQPQTSIDTMRRTYPIPPGRVSAAARSILTGTVEEIPDIHADPEYQHGHTANYRSIVAVPMLKDGGPVGAICMARTETGYFPERQVELLRTFADQAVIAIENTRLFEEVQTRTKELQESLEYQTATSDVLGVISRSPTQLQPVVDAIVQTAKRLCEAEMAQMWRLRDGKFDLLAHTHKDTELATYLAQNPIPTGPNSFAGRAVLEKRVVHVPDVRAHPEIGSKSQLQRTHVQTMLVVPLQREGEPIGVLSLSRTEGRPFSDKQIELVSTFADQAVIAINNVGLFEEVQARNRDLTALGEVGRAVSSTLDLKVVLKTIVDRAVELSGTDAGSIFYLRQETGRFELGETSGLDEEVVAKFRKLDISAGQTGLGEAIAQRQPLQVPDILKRSGNPLRDAAIEAGFRAGLIVPLLGSEGPLGALVLQRRRPGEFSRAVVNLMQSFADQSAIALENARLFDEIAQKSRELEIASQHKSQFVANMSHELRTPLAAMLGYAELLRDGMFGELPEKSIRIIERVQANGKHLLGLINTVLDISKIESGQFQLNLVEYSLDSMVETVRVATESLASAKKLSFRTDVVKGLPYGLGDEARLTQVLLNLVGNAIKFTDAGEVCISADAKNGSFAVSVSDTGPGIPDEERQRIFDKFHQVDSTSTKTKGGTGLGLAIAKEIVEMHGGRIWVESILGRGSTFRMELPVRAQASGAAA